jgi:hypothetical protein
MTHRQAHIHSSRCLARAPRGPSRVGEVWVFDPQGIVGELAGWWWNPLSYVTDEVKPVQVADVFALAGRAPRSSSRSRVTR